MPDAQAAGGPTSTDPELKPSGGLSEAEASSRLASDGRNLLSARAERRVLGALWEQVTDTVILVLLVAAILTAAVGDLADMTVIIAVIVLNATLGTLQQIRSDQALAALSAMTAPRSTVVRDGRSRDIEASEVVVGDLVELAAGDIVPADARLIRCESFTTDESMLTGESVPVGKAVGDEVLAGSVVTRGRGYAVVRATAHATVMGSIASSLAGGATSTPLQLQLSQLGRRLAVAAALAAVAVIAINLAGGRGWETSLVLGISLAVAAIPESLPAVVTLSLALAGRKLAGGGVLVRRLSAVEALGSITVLAMDKTGTLTEGRMAVARVWTPAGTAAAERRLLEYAALCSDAAMTPDVVTQRSDDPTEVALVRQAQAIGIDVAAVRQALPRIAESPFDAQTATMSTQHRGSATTVLRITKGSPESLLGPAELSGPAGQMLASLVGDGLRVLAVRAGSGPVAGPDADELVGLLGLQDPIRRTAPAMIQAFRNAGVRPVMISGDHPGTAAAVGRSLGLDRPDEVLTGAQLSAHPAASDDRRLAGHGVIARVRPEQKTVVVKALQRLGNVVAMTGDGVNDAPALRAADIGVAMGAGTEVAKQAAAIVLTSSDLSAMIPAIVEGRRVYDNIRRFLHYALSGGLAEVLIMVIAPLLGMAVPLQAGQILFVNLLTHGVPGVAIGNEPATADAADRAPRPLGQRLLDRGQAWRIGLLGTTVAVTSMLAGGWSAWHHRPAQSTLFLALTFAQLAIALAGRPPGHRLRENWMLLWSVLVNGALVLAAVFTGPLRELFRTRAVAAGDLVAALLGAVVVALLTRLVLRVADPGGTGGRPVPARLAVSRVRT